jgi:GR25 family glycosyltransferase involved in LPS biosynthesis
MLKEIFVINLEKDINRLENIKKNFNDYNIKFSRFNGIYGKNLSKDEINLNTSLLCRTLFCNKGIIGSGMSHFLLLKLIASKPDGWYMICEDDINFDEKSLQYIQKILDFLKGRENEAIMVNLNSCNAYNYNNNSKFLIKSNSYICGISCYIISSEAAKKLSNYITEKKINRYIDIQMSFCNCGLNYYYTPFPIVKDSTFGGFKTSNNMKVLYSIPFIQFIIDLFLPYKWSSIINFRLNIPIICFFLKFCITIGQIFIIILAISNIFIIKSFWINN